MGPGKIDEYNKSLTPEQRKKNASKAGKAKRAKRVSDIRAIAKIINEAPAPKKAREGLERVGLDKDEYMTNAAMIAAAVFKAAFEGDMKAVEKWEKYVGQYETATAGENGMLADLIDGLREPCEMDLCGGGDA